jgi:hypothetical protein
MRVVILTIVLMSNLVASAQRVEIGLGAGAAMHTGMGGSIFYKATNAGISPAATGSIYYNFNQHNDKKLNLQVGAEASHGMELRNTSTTTYSYFNLPIGNDGKYFRYAQEWTGAALLGNVKYRYSERAFAYGGIAVGMLQTRNESNRSGSDFADKPYTYTAPDGGQGIGGGIQLGYNYRLSRRFAINAEVAARYYSIAYEVNDASYPGGTSFNYAMLMVPVTLGVRYSIGYPPEWRYTWQQDHK